MPSDVPDSANSTSCTARALPASTTSTKPRRMMSPRSARRRRCARPPARPPRRCGRRLFFTSRIICGDARDAAFDAALRRDVVAHEREAEAVALAELGRDADAVVAADHRFAGLHVAQLAALGARRSRRRSPRPCAASRLPPTGRPRARACGGWWWSRSRRGRSGPFPPASRTASFSLDRVAAEGRELLQQVGQRRARRAP